MRKPKVYMVHNIVAPYRHVLYEKLAEKLDLTVFYCSVKEDRKWDHWPRKYDYKYEVMKGFSAFNQYFNPSIIKKIIHDRPDAIVVGGYSYFTMQITMLLSYLRKIPIVLFIEGTAEPKTLAGRLSKPFRSLIFRNVTSVIVPGGLSKKYMLNFNVPEERVHTAPNTIDNQLFVNYLNEYAGDREKIRRRLGVEGKVAFLYIGRLVEEKGISYLLKAFKRLKQENQDIALLLVGYGDGRKRYEEKCAQENITDVIFTGYINSVKKLVKIYMASDVFVFPTLRDLWGFVINEAMVTGLPVVSTCESQAAQELVREGVNGYLVEPKNDYELYNRLTLLTTDSELRKSMGENSKRIIMNDFTTEVIANGNLRAISDALERNSKRMRAS